LLKVHSGMETTQFKLHRSTCPAAHEGVWGNEGTPPLISNLGNGFGGGVSLKPGSLYPRDLFKRRPNGPRDDLDALNKT